MDHFNHIDGDNKGKVVLYAISTCAWCRKTRKLLESLNVEFDCIYMDLLTGPDLDAVKREVRKYNTALSYPTLVIDDSRIILGFDEDAIKEKLA